MTTNPLGSGPALTVATSVPDLHHFSGRGGKDVIPLYRDAKATEPNVTKGLVDRLSDEYGRAEGDLVTAEQLTAYVYAVLGHPGYTSRFAAALTRPGPRVPLTADGSLFDRAVDLGEHLLWLHTYAERFKRPEAGRGPTIPNVPSLGWVEAVTELPVDGSKVAYDPITQILSVGNGRVAGVLPTVWNFSVSGFPVVPRWLGSRTSKGTGRAATRPKPLDLIRPSLWIDSWNDELLELLRVLSHTVSLYPVADELLGEICSGPLLDQSSLPQPAFGQRSPPLTSSPIVMGR
jgi:hypothetical protein